MASLLGSFYHADGNALYAQLYQGLYVEKNSYWKKSHEIQFPRGEKLGYPWQSFPKMYFTLAVKNGSGKFFSFR